MKNIFYLLISVGLISCGESRHQRPQISSVTPIAVENPQGEYQAFLRPINTHIYGRIASGKASMKISEKEFAIKLFMDDAYPSVHQQFVFSGDSCPEMNDDENKDGYLDLEESKKKTGMRLIPLDKDGMATPHEISFFPSGKNYLYSKNINMEELMKNLQTPDPVVEKKFLKLLKNKPLDLDKRIVMILATSKNFPKTITDLHPIKQGTSIPIACGVIEKI